MAKKAAAKTTKSSAKTTKKSEVDETKKATTAKPAAKKAAKKSAAKKSAVKKTTTKKAAEPKADAPKASEAKTAPVSKSEPVAPTVIPQPKPAKPVIATSTAESGSIKPAAKRAPVSGINGTALYRQERGSHSATVVTSEGVYYQEPTMELPASYGRTKISVLVRDAEWLFAFWEIAENTRESLELSRNSNNYTLVLRLYDVTGIEFTGSNAHSIEDIPVNDYTSSWYIHVPKPGRRYIVELGVLSNSGGYQSITRSSAIEMPAARISDDINWDWEDQNEEVHLQILQMSGGARIPSRLSSADFVSELHRRLLAESAGASESYFSGSVVSSADFYSSESRAALQPEGKKDRKFWLVVDAEVIVYGATEPDAKVKFMGRNIRLNPDGTFGVRMALPDGTIEFPVEATSSDEIETLRVCPIVNRNTVS